MRLSGLVRGRQTAGLVGLLAVGLVWGAGNAALSEADGQWLAGQKDAAAAGYTAVVKAYADRTDLSDAERLEYAAALTGLALAQVEPVAAKDGAERRTKSIAKQLKSVVGARVLTEIGFGQEIKITDHAAKDKPTLFYFGSPYCPPCMEHLPLIEQMAIGQTDYGVVFVNVNRPEIEGIDWQSPVCKQFGLESLPTLKFYNPDGTVLAEGDAAIEKINEALGKMGD